jgi:alpha-tubulin suppressor-like RCC1 family protein
MLLLVAAAAITQLSCGDQTCAAVKNDGKVIVWGRYNPGKEQKSDTPREVPGLSGVKEAAVGLGFLLVLKQDGTLWA